MYQIINPFITAKSIKTAQDTNVTVHQLKEEIEYLKALLQELHEDKFSLIYQRNSPLTLNEKDKKLSKELKIEDIIELHWDKIEKAMNKSVTHKNAYDVQEAAFKIGKKVDKLLPEPDALPIKNHAYRTGIPMYVYHAVFALLIRDKYMKINEIE